MISANKTKTPLRFLLIEQDPVFVRQMQTDLSLEFGERCALQHVMNTKQASLILRSQQFDVILVDLSSLSGLDIALEGSISKICRLAKTSLIIAMSAENSVSMAVDAMGAGAHDCLTKPLSMKVFGDRITELGQRHGHAIHGHAITVTSHKNSDECTGFEGFVGSEAQMKTVYEQIVQMAPSSAPVFITGESGTGKELCAKALHQRGSRANKPFIAINCSVIPRELMESEIFGVARSACSGADKNRPGAVERAAGGVLFLDEISELELGLQAKLLRFLQTGTISRVGETISRNVNVRVVCATVKNPMKLIAERKFREDLFYHLHVLPINLPPLRQRSVDILPLAQSFLERYSAEEKKRFCGFSPETQKLMSIRDWPGNVRQLQNLIRRIVIMFDGTQVNAQMLNSAEVELQSPHNEIVLSSSAQVPIEPMWRQEQKIIETAIACHNGNISLAAAALEISPSTIYRKKQAWEQLQTNSASNNTFVA